MYILQASLSHSPKIRNTLEYQVHRKNGRLLLRELRWSALEEAWEQIPLATIRHWITHWLWDISNTVCMWLPLHGTRIGAISPRTKCPNFTNPGAMAWNNSQQYDHLEIPSCLARWFPRYRVIKKCACGQKFLSSLRKSFRRLFLTKGEEFVVASLRHCYLII